MGKEKMEEHERDIKQKNFKTSSNDSADWRSFLKKAADRNQAKWAERQEIMRDPSRRMNSCTQSSYKYGVEGRKKGLQNPATYPLLLIIFSGMFLTYIELKDQSD